MFAAFANKESQRIFDHQNISNAKNQMIYVFAPSCKHLTWSETSILASGLLTVKYTRVCLYFDRFLANLSGDWASLRRMKSIFSCLSSKQVIDVIEETTDLQKAQGLNSFAWSVAYFETLELMGHFHLTSASIIWLSRYKQCLCLNLLNFFV